MGRITTLEERMLFRELARAGHNDDEIAEQTGWSVSTVRKCVAEPIRHVKRWSLLWGDRQQEL